ncbi:MAG: hypothetical protein IKF71_05960 [Bacilli bacterium]|nr:hypothetical protein [Bacilli bacterium]
MKKIYIVLSYTGTILSRAIKLYTRKEYSHVSISLDKNMEHMYSFGRLNAYNPFIGGFVQESPHFGTFKRFKHSKIKVYSLNVSDEDYERIQDTIHKFEINHDKYGFNFMGVVTAAGNYRMRRKYYYYCAEFVKYVLENTSLKLNLPEIVKPEDFQKLEGLQEVFTGILSDYKVA